MFGVGLVVAIALAGLSPGHAAAHAPRHDGHGSAPPGADGPPPGMRVEDAFRDWHRSDDFAVTGEGGPDGYRLAIAREREQFIARPLATIQPGGYAEDDWLGYQCVTGDSRYVVVTLMPRRAVNNPAARDRGALLYSVRVSDGSVRPLLWGVAMKQHAVNCGAGALAAAVRHLDTDQRRSELLLVDAATGRTRSAGVVEGQLTWPVPADQQTLLAVRGRSVVRTELQTGRRTSVATFDGTPIAMASAPVGVDLLVAQPGGTTVDAYNLRGLALRGTAQRRLGSGPFGDVRLVRVASGPNLLYGISGTVPVGARKATSLRPTTAAPRPEPVVASVRGGLVLAAAPPGRPGWLKYTADGGHLVAGTLTQPDPTGMTATALPGGVQTMANSTNPTCGVPRNDPRRQAFGPTNVQVQWAVEMASRNRLSGANARPANYLQSGLPAYNPSNDFAIPTLLPSGGRVPPVVMNAILAQENNYRHASRRSLPGSGGNPAISDYYGAGGTLDRIDYDQADCGYGIAQVTTGMRLSDTSISPNGKAKIAIDYAENVQAGTQILAKKWNQLYTAGIRINNSDPSIVENWYFAIWAYNTGVQPDANHGNTTGCTPGPSCTDGAGHWGLGWANNPMNPDYPAQRGFFLRNTYADAEHPSDWPYQERVLGWMATPVHTYKGDAAYPAVVPISSGPVVEPLGMPDRTLFCSIIVNNCSPNSPAGCALSDYHCWWNQPVSWPLDCATTCHVSPWTFADTAPEPSSTNPWPPACNSDLGPDAVIVDNLQNPSQNLFCPSRNWSNQGTFTYSTGSLGQIDLHQLATGFGAHTWFTGNRLASDAAHRVTGTWTPSNLAAGVYTVRVHIPVAGASATAAVYKVTLADGSVRQVTVNQHEHYNHWKSLGGFALGSNAKVELDNVTANDAAGGRTTVAFDAVAFVPTPGTYVERRIDAVAYFDEDTELRSNAPTSWVGGIFASAQAAYDWAVNASAFASTMPACGGQPAPDCVMPRTRTALLDWRANVLDAGSGHGLDHPTGKSVMQWLGLANDYHQRPNSPTEPSWFDTDDSSYKIRSSATVSFVIGSDGRIVPGSADVTYDDRTGDTHLPKFVTDLFVTLQQDYGIAPPDLSYATVNANEYDHQTTLATPNDDGVMPGRAFKHAGAPPAVLDADGLPTTSGGTCVMANYISGGVIGYRPMIQTGYVPAAVLGWRDRVRDTAAVPQQLKSLSVDVFGDFFMVPGISIISVSPPIATVVGSPMGLGLPIWQELAVKVCADGTVHNAGTSALVLRASHMPNQYLYLDGESIDLQGTRNYTSRPIIDGSFPRFTNVPDPGIGGYVWPNQFGNCGVDTGQNGNPWGIQPTETGDLNPNSVHFCNFPGYGGDPEYG
jgi:hypothetical protein